MGNRYDKTQSRKSLNIFNYNLDLIIEYLSSPAGLNKIVLLIIIFAAINAFFILYAFRNSVVKVIEENKKGKIQKEKIDRLYPSGSTPYRHHI